MWLGVDVGAQRKGFDVALIDADLRLVDLQARLDVAAVVELVRAHQPKVVGIDSPQVPARDGEHLRGCELLLNASVCGIRWTPDLETLGSSQYYAWILCGFDLHEAVGSIAGTQAVEVFPTASWTRWFDRRVGTRARWTSDGLGRLPLSGIPTRTNQDQRDAIAAAVTAWQISRGQCEFYGEIAVPTTGMPTFSPRRWREI